MKKTNVAQKLWRLIKENLSFLIVMITTFLALALIVTMTFGSYYKSDKENAITIGKMTVTLEAQRIKDAMDFGINTLDVSGYTVDSMLQKGAGPEEIEEYLTKETQGIISGIEPDFSGIYGVVHDVYVDGSDWVPEPGYDPYSRPWYTAAAAMNKKLAIVSPYIDAQTNKLMVSFSKILCDGKSAISMDISLDNIYAVTETIQLNGNGYCFLVDREGSVIAHRDNTQVGKNYLTDEEFQGSDIQDFIKKINNSAEVNELQDIKLGGEKHMAFTHSVYDTWNVVLVVSNNDLFKTLRTGLIRNILISLTIFILVGYFCTSNYINKKRALRYAEDVRTDDLTGLNNRGEFDRYLHTTLNGIPMEKKLYLLLFDADGFKSINDKYGHQEGDRALRLIAKTLMGVCHGTDWFCARYGGDEFVIVCKCDDESTVKKIIDDIDVGLKNAASENHLAYTPALSCGYACFDPHRQTLTDLVDMADQSLYGVKAQKKA